MANRANLYSVSSRSTLPFVLEKDEIPAGEHCVRVADSANFIPLSWLCCFSKEDLMPYNIMLGRWTDTGTEQFLAQLDIACVDKSIALARLSAARSLFDTIAGDSEIGLQYWQLAMDMLSALPHQFIAIDPADMLLESDESEAHFYNALTDNSTRIESLCYLSMAEVGAAAYPLIQLQEHYFQLDKDQKLFNSDALYTYVDKESWS